MQPVKLVLHTEDTAVCALLDLPVRIVKLVREWCCFFASYCSVDVGLSRSFTKMFTYEAV